MEKHELDFQMNLYSIMAKIGSYKDYLSIVDKKTYSDNIKTEYHFNTAQILPNFDIICRDTLQANMLSFLIMSEKPNSNFCFFGFLKHSQIPAIRLGKAITDAAKYPFHIRQIKRNEISKALNYVKDYYKVYNKAIRKDSKIAAEVYSAKQKTGFSVRSF